MVLLRDSIGRLSTERSFFKLKPIKSINLPALHQAHSAGSSISSCFYHARDERKALHTISSSEPCFITKRPGYGLDKIYFLSLAPTDNEDLKVEHIVYELGIVPEGFRLNSANNMASIDLTLQYTLSNFGLFAITCSKATLEIMIKLVKKENRKPVLERRQFNLMSPPFLDAKYEMVVLYPNYLLPNGVVLPVYTTNAEGHLDHKVYMASEDGALREGRDATSPRLPAFSNPNIYRAEDLHLNPLLVILNAEMIFRRFKRSNPILEESLCKDYCELVELTLELADEIYHGERVKLACSSYETVQKPLVVPRPDPQLEDKDGCDTDSGSDGIYEHVPTRSRRPIFSLSEGYADYILSERDELIDEQEALKLAQAADDEDSEPKIKPYQFSMASIQKVLDWQSDWKPPI